MLITLHKISQLLTVEQLWDIFYIKCFWLDLFFNNLNKKKLNSNNKIKFSSYWDLQISKLKKFGTAPTKIVPMYSMPPQEIERLQQTLNSRHVCVVQITACCATDIPHSSTVEIKRIATSPNYQMQYPGPSSHKCGPW